VTFGNSRLFCNWRARPFADNARRVVKAKPPLGAATFIPTLMRAAEPAASRGKPKLGELRAHTMLAMLRPNTSVQGNREELIKKARFPDANCAFWGTARTTHLIPASLADARRRHSRVFESGGALP
jgi:hypothetical protein